MIRLVEQQSVNVYFDKLLSIPRLSRTVWGTQQHISQGVLQNLDWKNDKMCARDRKPCHFEKQNSRVRFLRKNCEAFPSQVEKLLKTRMFV